MTRHLSSKHQGMSRFWLGANYWPGQTGIRMWSRWQPDLIRKDLKKMIDLGMNVHRSFIFLPDFMPTAHEIAPVMKQRLGQYLQMCDEIGIGVMLTLFVGHMSGQNWDVVWRGESNFYTDPELLAVQRQFVEEIVVASRDSAALIGWVLSNEIPIFEPRGSADEVTTWVQDIIDTIHSHDTKHPVTVGDGCWGPEISRRTPHFHLRKLAPLQDYLGLHFYPRTGNPWHQAFTAGLRLQMAAAWDKPVVVEEFGHSTTMGSEINQAHYYRTVLYSSLINGARGVINWCFTDIDLPDEQPYNHHPFEMRFGLVRGDESIRPAGLEIQRFSVLTSELDEQDYQMTDTPRVGLIVPASYYITNPHDWDADFADWYPLYLETFALLKRANLQVQCIYEPAVEGQDEPLQHDDVKLDPEATPLLVLPRLKRITAPFWRQLLAYVESGGILYTSYAHDHWIPDWEETFGLVSDVALGLPTMPESRSVSISTATDWEPFRPGETCGIPVTNATAEMAYCPVLGHSAEELLVDQAGQPALVRKAHGRGWLYFSLYPIEMMLLKAGDHPSGAFWSQVYQAIWRQVNDRPRTWVQGQDLEWNAWTRTESTDTKVVVVNHAWSARKGILQLDGDRMLNVSANLALEQLDPGKFAFELDRQAVFIASIGAANPNGHEPKDISAHLHRVSL